MLGLIAAVIGYALFAHPLWTLVILLGILVVSVVLELHRWRRVRPLFEARAGEDIGSFARAFDRKSGPPLDTWAIRAVWDALLPLTSTRGRTIPLRPGDRIDSDLGIDPEEIEFLVPELVERCGRLPGKWDENPYSEKLATVGDLVYLVSAQPLRDGVRSAVGNWCQSSR